MKKIVMMSWLATTPFLYAGGNIAPIEDTPIAIAEPIAVSSAYYIGVAVTPMKIHNDLTQEEFSTTGLTLLVGYQYNDYIGIEGRYSTSVAKVKYDAGNTSNPNSDDIDTNFQNIALYLKPSYIMDAFKLYALLGYGEVSLSSINGADRAESRLQWGIGASYAFTENMALFVDYVNLYKDTEFDHLGSDADHLADSLSVGVTYIF